MNKRARLLPILFFSYILTFGHSYAGLSRELIDAIANNNETAIMQYAIDTLNQTEPQQEKLFQNELKAALANQINSLKETEKKLLDRVKNTCRL